MINLHWEICFLLLQTAYPVDVEEFLSQNPDYQNSLTKKHYHTKTPHQLKPYPLLDCFLKILQTSNQKLCFWEIVFQCNE